MKILSDKIKQYLVLLIKILVVSAAFYYIYNQLSNDETLDFHILGEVVSDPKNYLAIAALMFLTFSNRFVEILKWQSLSSLIKPVSVGQAAKQVLSALTLGIFTPNGIGEYAGKALYFEKKDAPRVIFLNMVCNGVQVIYAIVFGLIGLTILNQFHEIIPNTYLYIVYAVIAVVFTLLFSIRNFAIKGYSIQTILNLLNEIPKKKHRKNLFLALLRYASFTHQYVILYYLFGVDIPYFELLCAVSAIYLMASSLPNFQFLEFAVKGSIAMFIFTTLDVNQWVVALVATLIWLLNIVLPISIGSYFVLTFKVKK
ncbi:flippase-like domain-containing protein [Myroides odoratimimus]|uniref:lysylphosphatidylglycerol synthase domain-containing protein n=1 Tax=Myroides odoratimimus TaxID=76832 RepID=UPI00104005DA|nr:lysylphosphatidylglycerol synthase domain-containing protein [Myroides odoratimimus]MCA4794002.1 flippase-like domain-containing protein [Myroides odoratimimus]MCA4807122.1 flippase-like domain-containing protein [Myroides odoratimimus]MCA4821262.1 flippase-like domain-containing protein [Myroides odoratimimus]MDM1059993.1 flippase-like domain-containing protein [Myroides odoratimimus]MDM1094068.1 flippase-like domain-containing protein [Myroides odoratimimus]